MGGTCSTHGKDKKGMQNSSLDVLSSDAVYWCMVVSCRQNSGQDHNLLIVNNSFKN
jgi:hypothetical protein